MKTTRQRLIEYLRSKKVVSASEVSRALKMTAANARHHLSILEDEGVIEVVDRRIHGRGRPTQLYGLSYEMSRHNMDNLAKALFEEVLGHISSEQKDVLLVRIANRILGERKIDSGSLTTRLNHAVRHLAQMNYGARWEAHAESPHIILAHCPYAVIVPDYPELCKMDAFLLEIASGLSVVQTTKLERSSQGGVQCVFKLCESGKGGQRGNR